MNLNQLFDLKGNVALCTGATSGIGQRMAQVLAGAGADVVLVGRRKDKLVATTDQINQSSQSSQLKGEGAGKASYVVADLTDRKILPDVVKQTASQFNAPDILVNAAGVNFREPYEDITSDSWDETININLSIPFFLARECVPSMIKKGYGKIINIASLQSYRAFANSMPYGASKGGIVQLTRAMAQAWSKDGIMANAIAPGFFRTELTEKVYQNPELVKHNANMTAVGRNGEMEDFDGITIFLASKASHYITGQTIALDGGFTAK